MKEHDKTRPPTTPGAGPEEAVATLITTGDESTGGIRNGADPEGPEGESFDRDYVDRELASSKDVLVGRVFDPAAMGYHDETHVAEALAHRVHRRERVVFDAVRDMWLQWGTDTNEQPVWLVVPSSPADYARTLAGAAAQVLAPGDAKAEDFTLKSKAQLRRRFNTSAGVGALAKLLLDVARRPGSVLYTRADIIDATDDAESLWAGGRLWHLRTSAMLEPGEKLIPSGYDSRDMVHMKTAACEPDNKCPTPLWNAFLDAVFADDDEARAYFLTVMGVAVTGTSDRVMVVLYGPSGRGKSYAAKLVLSALGSYGYTAPASLLGDNPDKAHEAELEGRRLVFVDEGPRTNRLGVERLKALTGGTRQTTRALYSKPTSWAPKFTLVMTSNEMPPVADPALRARLRPVDFTDAQPDEVRAIASEIGEPDTSPAWRREMPGVLAQLMEHAGRYLRDRSVADVPGWVSEALDDMEEEQNPVKAWLADRTIDGEAKASDLHEDFVAWCHRAGIRNPWGLPRWGQAMTEGGHVVRKTKHGNYRPRALKTDSAGPAWLVEGQTSTSSTPLPPANGVATRPLPTPGGRVEERIPFVSHNGEGKKYGGKIGNCSSTSTSSTRRAGGAE